MRLDDVDISIIKYIGILGDHVKTTDVVKYMYETKTNHEFKLKDNFIRNRLKSLESKGILESEEDSGISSYFLSDSYVVLSGTPVISINGTEFKGDTGVYIFVLEKEVLSSILS